MVEAAVGNTSRVSAADHPVDAQQMQASARAPISVVSTPHMTPYMISMRP